MSHQQNIDLYLSNFNTLVGFDLRLQKFAAKLIIN